MGGGGHHSIPGLLEVSIRVTGTMGCLVLPKWGSGVSHRGPCIKSLVPSLVPLGGPVRDHGHVSSQGTVGLQPLPFSLSHFLATRRLAESHPWFSSRCLAAGPKEGATAQRPKPPCEPQGTFSLYKQISSGICYLNGKLTDTIRCSQETRTTHPQAHHNNQPK